MCLILAATASQVRTVLLETPGLIEDIYTSNPDGIGAMYATAKNKMRVPKIVPRSSAEARAFIKQLPGDSRPLAVHWRWKTHGAIDMENTHPYSIVEGEVHFMHNGVLSHGNKADPTKSDTWHYAKNVLRPQLSLAPDLFKVPEWVDLIEDDIGTGNRFVFMNRFGEMVIANKHTGIDVEGVWFANTYAWSPELLIPGYSKPVPTQFGRMVWPAYDYDADDSGYEYLGEGKFAGGITSSHAHDGQFNADDVWAAIGACDADDMVDLLLDYPLSTMKTLFDSCDFIPLADEGAYSEGDAFIVRLLVDKDTAELAKFMKVSDHRAKHVAEVMCWYGDWVGLEEKAVEAKGEVVESDDEHTGEVRPRVKAISAPVQASTDAKWSAKSPVTLVH